MSNVAGKAYGMNVVTPMRPCADLDQPRSSSWWRAPSRATWRGLLGLSIIHFARWVIIKRDQWPDLGQGKQTLQNDYMLFCSNFNGTWDQYIDAFSDGIPSGLDLLWYLEHEISAFDPDQPVQELHPGEPDRHGLLLQFGPGRRAARHQGGVARPARHSRSGRQARLVGSGRISARQYVADAGRGAERPRLPGLCAGRQHRHEERRRTIAPTYVQRSARRPPARSSEPAVV